VSAAADTERILETRRLVLEPLLPRHAPLLFVAMSDERLYRYHAGRPRSLEALQARFTQLASRGAPDRAEVWLNWAVRLKNSGYVGLVQATVHADQAIIGYDIFAEHWRHGYGKEACTALVKALYNDWAVKLLIAIVDVENVASIALLESLGFQRTWTGPSEDMPGRTDHRYEKRAAA
jgi:[ribosomal protein S5]-alanine N-acetyltransferase